MLQLEVFLFLLVVDFSDQVRRKFKRTKPDPGDLEDSDMRFISKAFHDMWSPYPITYPLITNQTTIALHGGYFMTQLTSLYHITKSSDETILDAFYSLQKVSFQNTLRKEHSIKLHAGFYLYRKRENDGEDLLSCRGFSQEDLSKLIIIPLE